ncbi:MAG: hypothetical protein NZ898_15225 [Myxococcota bacterium]|nr:hypothetical protein [Myxococcota bacterium]
MPHAFANHAPMSVATLTVLFLVVGCGGDPEPPRWPGLGPGERLELEPFDHTLVLTSAQVELLEPVELDGRLVARRGFPRVTARSVLVGPANPDHPHGVLWLVRSAESMTDGSQRLEVVPAPIQLAFRRLHLRLRRSLQDLAAAASAGRMPATQLARL